MRIGVIGPGRIGGNLARLLAAAGHEIVLSFGRDAAALERLAGEIGSRASVATPAEAARCEVVVLSVPWAVIPAALEAMGAVDGRIVIDTTNQFGPGPKPAPGQTAAAFNAARLPGARYTKCFNTLTSAFQAAAAGREGDARVVQWICGDDEDAKRVVAALVEEAGYVPIDVGGTAECAVMEAPRRPGAVYGEEYRAAEAAAAREAVKRGEPIPPTPSYA
jgi:8-hydroxy-5-deazaflavin:NADPH oxidoreductase